MALFTYDVKICQKDKRCRWQKQAKNVTCKQSLSLSFIDFWVNKSPGKETYPGTFTILHVWPGSTSQTNLTQPTEINISIWIFCRFLRYYRHRGQGVMMSLPVWLPGLMFLPGRSLSRGGLCLRVSVWRVSVWEDPGRGRLPPQN